jgi:spore coat polysaccharide biosynthesis protein SpsF (cytidylyltransferase family)
MKILGVVVARRGSERLPGKVLRELAGEPMLLKVLARASRAERLSDLVVALPDGPNEDSTESLCRSSGYFCFRGAEYDILDRIFRTAIAYGADIVVPLRASCPIIDGQLIDAVVEKLLDNKSADWCSNRLPKPTYPRGLEVDAIRIDTLRRAWMEDTHAGSRQYPESFLIRRPDLFSSVGVSHSKDLSHIPWHVFTLSDLNRVRTVFTKLGDSAFSWQDALSVWETMPPDADHSDTYTETNWQSSEA